MVCNKHVLVLRERERERERERRKRIKYENDIICKLFLVQ